MFSAASVCLFVCQFVCQHNNFRTIKHSMMKLGGQVHCTKISLEFECQDQRSNVKVTGDKKQKVRHFVRESSFGAWSSASSIRRWENQRMLSSYSSLQCSHCKRCTSYGNSVCLSVCLSVRLSHAGIVSKRRHVARCSLHCQIAECVQFCRDQKLFPRTTPSP